MQKMKIQTNRTATTVFAALLLCFSMKAKADSWTSSGNYSISWYNKNQTEFTITTNKELAGVAYLVNNGYTTFSGKTIKLGADIDLSGKEWDCIGREESYYFQGTFDGQGHSINGISILRESGYTNYFGFFGQIIYATICNATLHGNIIIKEPTYNYLKQLIGGLVAYAEHSNVNKCNCLMNVEYNRAKTNSFGPSSSSNAYTVNVGGMIGRAESTTIQYCTHEGDVKCNFGTSAQNGEYYSGELAIRIGGIVGYAIKTSIEYCENHSLQIACEASGSVNSSNLFLEIGGIAGFASTGAIRYSVNDSDFKAVSRGSNGKAIVVGGIAGSASITYYSYERNGGTSVEITNCYSSSTWIHAGAGSNSTQVFYGGIVGRSTSGGTESSVRANFSASDLSVNQSTLTKVKGYNGSTSFSSVQMQSDAFLEELNVYPILEFEKAVWTRDNSYPYIAELHESTAIQPVIAGKDKDNCSIFFLSGQRLDFPRKGINIVGGKKVMVK